MHPTRLLAATLLLAGAAVALPGATASAATPGLTASFSASDYGSYWVDKYIVTNPTSASVTGWTLEFDVPPGLNVGQGYYGQVTRSGNHVTVVNEHYNGTVAAGKNTEPYSFWFIATGTNTQPLNCRINGNKCDGSADRAPGAPGGLAVSGRTTKTVSLRWNAAAATDFPIAGYDVYQGGTLKASVTDTAATVTGLSPTTVYSFTVRAKDTRGNVPADSAPVSATTLNPADDTTAPPAPGNLHAVGKTAVSVSLAWNAVTDPSGIAGYDIYAGGALEATTSATSATVTGLAPLTAYSFTVKARDTYDNASPASAVLQVTTDDSVGSGSYAKVGYFVQWGIYGRQ